MSNKKDSLGDRMKTYENVPKNFLMRRTPVVIRIDGRAFHTLTRGFVKPFDYDFNTAMARTALYLCQKIQGCVMGYTQSDEISLVLCDYQTLETDAWFGYNVEKIVSVSAAMATVSFNHNLMTALNSYEEFLKKHNKLETFYNKKIKALERAIDLMPTFDSRAFNLSKEEVNNYLIWRQNDAIRNSIQAIAQSEFSCKQLQGLSCCELIEKLKNEKGINWNEFPIRLQRGTCIFKDNDGKWVIDDSPRFTLNSDFINSRINFD